MTTDELGLPPSPFEQKRRLRGWRRAALAVVLVALSVAAFTVQLPVFYTYLPGPVRDVAGLVDIDGAQTYSSEGKLYLTTVSVDTEVTVAELIAAIVDPTKAVVRREDVTGGGSLEELRREQRRDMRDSKRHAMEVVFAALGMGKPTGDGARVEGTIPDAPADGVLRKGDVIVEVDGEAIETTCDVGRIVDQHEPGDRIDIKIERNHSRRTFTVGTIKNPEDESSPLVGVLMSDVDYTFKPGVEVTFETGRIAGPSAGLMFSLALYDRLTPEDLTQGRQIAGTGTIMCDGGVGAIGGIAQKVAGAERRGAEIFFSPVGNLAAARAAAGEIDVVAISNFQDAVDYLEGLDRT